MLTILLFSGKFPTITIHFGRILSCRLHWDFGPPWTWWRQGFNSNSQRVLSSVRSGSSVSQVPGRRWTGCLSSSCKPSTDLRATLWPNYEQPLQHRITLALTPSPLASRDPTTYNAHWTDEQIQSHPCSVTGATHFRMEPVLQPCHWKPWAASSRLAIPTVFSLSIQKFHMDLMDLDESTHYYDMVDSPQFPCRAEDWARSLQPPLLTTWLGV